MNTSLLTDKSSDKLISPILIVVIRIVGPTIARKAFTANAFFTSFKKSMAMAADNSINADKIRRPAIDITAESRW